MAIRIIKCHGKLLHFKTVFSFIHDPREQEKMGKTSYTEIVHVFIGHFRKVLCD